MGAPDRIEFAWNKVIGFGISYDTFPYQISLDFFIPFIRISIGLGKPYTEV